MFARKRQLRSTPVCVCVCPLTEKLRVHVFSKVFNKTLVLIQHPSYFQQEGTPSKIEDNDETQF